MFSRLVRSPINFYRTQASSIHRITKEASWLVAAQVASVLGSLALVRVLTESLEPEAYGQLALGLALGGCVNLVIMNGISSGAQRFYSIAVEKNDLTGYLYAICHLFLAAIAIVVVMGILLVGILAASGFYNWLWLVLAVLAFSTFQSLYLTLNGIQNSARQRAIVALHVGMDSALKIGFVVGSMYWLGRNSTAVVIGYVVTYIFLTVSQFFFLKKLVRASNSPKNHADVTAWSKVIWKFSWPWTASGVFIWARQMSDRWSLERFSTVAEVGQYAVLFQLGYAPICMLIGLVSGLISPILFQRSCSATDVARNATVHCIAWRITFVCLAFTALAFIVAWLFHDRLFSYLVAESFRDVSSFLPWVVLAGGLFAAGQTLSIKLMSELRSQSQLRTNIVTALFGTCANFFGAWIFGLEGVVGGLLVFSALYFCWTAVLANSMPEVNELGLQTTEKL